MRILGLIPARGGSKGIPGKNIKLLGGKPLITYSIEVGLACPLLEMVVVTSEDEAILAVSRDAGAVVPFIRPVALATDESPSIDSVIHALEYFQQTDQKFDAVCLLQPTVPFRKPAQLTAAIQKFLKTGADSLISVREVPHSYNPHWIFEKTNDSPFLQLATGDDTIISRRQDLPTAYYRDGAIYITKTEIVLKQHSLYGKKIVPYLTKDSPDINLDTMDDWKKAEDYLIQKTPPFE